MDTKETSTVAISISFKDATIMYAAAISFFIIIGANVLIKKIIGYFLEIDVKTRFWSIYQYGFRKDSHFRKPLPMLGLPLLLSFFTGGFFWWLAILEFDIAPKTERVAKRHGLYRFAELTEWHVAWIAIWGIILNLVLAVIAYIAGFEMFARLSLYFAAWSILPLPGLDGAKIFFSNKGLWTIFFIITMIILGWGLIVI